MRLRNGTEHEPLKDRPEEFNISTFTIDDLPFAANQQNETHLGRLDTPILALPISELIGRTHGPDDKRFLIEFYKRFSYPAACLVLILVGVPLGVTSRRGGEKLRLGLHHSACNPLLLAVSDRDRTRPSKMDSDIPGRLVGQHSLCSRRPVPTLATGQRQPDSQRHCRPSARTSKNKIAAPAIPIGVSNEGLLTLFRGRPRSKSSYRVFPRILDQYVVLEFLNMFALVLLGFVLLMLVFIAFDFLSDILRHHIPSTTVGDYLINLTPFLLDQLVALAVLIAVLVTFGVFNRNSEIIAIKATGISLYRLVVPFVTIAAILAMSLFLFDEFYLPQANRRQDALRNNIKGKPAQTVTHPEQNWIFGAPRKGEPGRIFYYRFFDPDRSEFANISLFEFAPSTFALTRRVFAAKALWDPGTASWRFHNGWENDIEGDHPKDFHQFTQTSFFEIHEEPGYFNKESLQAQQMNFGQLKCYIGGMCQSGFNTMKLRVALWHKLAYPSAAIVMAVLAIPFALSMGRCGSLTGIAVGIGVALAFWVIDNLSCALGCLGCRCPLRARWRLPAP
jgi:LPS export ABC transporter permease LptG